MLTLRAETQFLMLKTAMPKLPFSNYVQIAKLFWAASTPRRKKRIAILHAELTISILGSHSHTNTKKNKTKNLLNKQRTEQQMWVI